MVDLDRLNAKIEDSGMTYETISKRSGIPNYTLARKLKGEGKITADEVVGLTKALRLKMSERNDIFLRPSVSENHNETVHGDGDR